MHKHLRQYLITETVPSDAPFELARKKHLGIYTFPSLNLYRFLTPLLIEHDAGFLLHF
jgi:hypothetical protein